MFVYSHLSNFSAIAITGDRAANLDLCLALMAFSSEGSFSCYTCCHTGPRFIRSRPKDMYPSPTIGCEPGTQGSSLRLRSAHSGRLMFFCLYIVWSFKIYLLPYTWTRMIFTKFGKNWHIGIILYTWWYVGQQQTPSTLPILGQI